MVFNICIFNSSPISSLAYGLIYIYIHTHRVRQWNLTFFERLVYESGASSCHARDNIGRVRFCSFSFYGAVGPTIPRIRRGDFFENGESVTVTQKMFRLHFNVGRHRRIPSRHLTTLFFMSDNLFLNIPMVLLNCNISCIY